MNNQQNFNPWNTGWQPANQNYGMNTQSQVPWNTNVTFVTSLEEALYRTNSRGSDMIYFHQNKDTFYRIKVDLDGRKTWAEFSYTSPSQDDTTPATKADIKAIEDRLHKLECDKLEANYDGESNG